MQYAKREMRKEKRNLTGSRFLVHETRGFTLIEMLIVIAVIGVLAVAVLSAINPVEQMKKARDTRRRSNAAELMNALERYYTTNEEYPTIGFGGSCAAASLVGSDDLTDLVPEELKPEFQSRIEDVANYLYAYEDANDLAHICYQIEAQANQALSDCEIGTITAACVPE